MTSNQYTSQIDHWIKTWSQWPVEIQNQALSQLSKSSLTNGIFKTEQRFQVPVPIEATDRQFAFQLIVKEFSLVDFVIEDYYATRMSLNQDRWTKPIIREDRVKGTIVEKNSDTIVVEGTDTEPFTLVFNVSEATSSNDPKTLTLDMARTTYFDQVRKFKPYIEEWKPHFGKAQLKEVNLEDVMGGDKKEKRGHRHGHDSACCQ
uniref:Uncharacterized protein n=1 Tax=Percolomonas cosmopolitus TaxID=63605 RepID=A0A7S1KNX7_9EUKA|eukprot:CAMPEP_0117445496 /NCGR_PEP_ID=MMETSP0759-20121206/5828_1 /TAXON_ID=63605 /ORGANISM="Percolomonas cosmopolitus, Strain WS" /LENGTH=203 /DNA_ID=CAMNT_0005237679 /DNA_START=34 /DNA_END=645 /DNA_ORIENTATION=+